MTSNAAVWSIWYKSEHEVNMPMTSNAAVWSIWYKSEHEVNMPMTSNAAVWSIWYKSELIGMYYRRFVYNFLIPAN